MTQTELPPATAKANENLRWRSLIGLALLGIVGVVGLISPYYLPSTYNPRHDWDHYLLRYALLAFAVGFGLSAVRSRERVERLLGTAVIVTGILLVAYIAWDLSVTGGRIK
ncbi:MAG: hypothetical protein K8T89_14945 [Planctomycetes bacterium]|nr:hypothetical protein [Planctomycetota bacterium]